jgi:hypothetical protein
MNQQDGRTLADPTKAEVMTVDLDVPDIGP